MTRVDGILLAVASYRFHIPPVQRRELKLTGGKGWCVQGGSDGARAKDRRDLVSSLHFFGSLAIFEVGQIDCRD